MGSIKNIATSMRASNWPTEPTDKIWLTQTIDLGPKYAWPANTYEDTIKVSHTIWKTLTLEKLTPELSDSTGMACFEHLWLPEGRGAVGDLKLIQWIDDNVSFKIGQYTLREWSQTKSFWLSSNKSLGRSSMSVPDDSLVDSLVWKLVDMGYSRYQAQEALEESDYDLQRVSSLSVFSIQIQFSGQM